VNALYVSKWVRDDLEGKGSNICNTATDSSR
jgi:hypothetical protein